MIIHKCIVYLFLNLSEQRSNAIGEKKKIIITSMKTGVSAMSWWSILLVEETRVPGEKH